MAERKALFVKGEVRVQPEIPDRVNNVDSKKKVDLQEAIVFDFMPPIVGEQFRTDPVLSRMLFRKAPVEGPFIAMNQAYGLLAERELRDGKIVPALEAYKFSLEADMVFTQLIARMQNNVLLSGEETKHTDMQYSGTSRLLINALKASGATLDQKAYSKWLDDSRALYNNWLGLNRTEFGSARYIEACMKAGRAEEALSLAEEPVKKMLKDDDAVKDFSRLAKLIRRSNQPKEILDVGFLKASVDRYRSRH